MALPQTIGFKAEAVDEEGIWCPCTVEDVSNDYVIVSFDGWNAEWNRRICDPREIRNRTEPDRKRKRRNLSSTKNPQISKTIRGDRLWIGDQETTVKEVDPIRDQILISLPCGEEFFVSTKELTTSKPAVQKVRRHNKKQKETDQKENKQTATDTQEVSPSRNLQAPQSTDPQAQPSRDTPTTLSSDFDFTMYVLSSGSVLKVGSLCFVDSCSSPFIITRIFKSSLGSSVQVSGIRCLCDGGKVVSVLCNFQVTVDCSFVCPRNSSGFNLSSVSTEVSKYVFQGQTRVFLSQERNFGNVLYLRELRRHALGAQMRQAVSNGISLNATRPAQPISLGAFEPFHDMMIFNLSEKNGFKIPFSLVGGYDVLDSIMGKGWDVKPTVILSLSHYLLFI